MRDFEEFNHLPSVQLHNLLGFDDEGHPLISLDDDPTPQRCTASVPLSAKQIGSQVAVLPLARDRQLLIIGVIQPPLTVAAIDEKKMVIEADSEITLRCGKSSITLTADGRIKVQGKQLLSRAEGQNRVQGASVQLN